MAGEFVCPWWIGYLLVCPVRRWLNDPAKILAPYVHEGMTVLEPGPGMGFFTLELALLAGPSGRVIAVDIQPKMIASLRRRAKKAGLAGRIEARLVGPDSLGVADMANKVDFALAFAVVHEFPDTGKFFADVAQALRPGAALLLAEPPGHVKLPKFDAELAAAAGAGLRLEARPEIRRNHTALLRKV